MSCQAAAKMKRGAAIDEGSSKRPVHDDAISPHDPAFISKPSIANEDLQLSVSRCMAEILGVRRQFPADNCIAQIGSPAGNISPWLSEGDNPQDSPYFAALEDV
jgi:hypothetical protein